jgi:hypothetical protein
MLPIEDHECGHTEQHGERHGSRERDEHPAAAGARAPARGWILGLVAAFELVCAVSPHDVLLV